MGRKNARDILFKLVFENMFVESKDSITYENFVAGENMDMDTYVVNISELDADNVDFIKTNYLSVLKHKQEIIDIIAKQVMGYTVDNMFKLDLSIIVLAVNELIYYKQTPTKIVVNEAVELAKKYSTDKSAGFINGILAKIIEDLDIEK